MNYSELKSIASKYVTLTPNQIPQNMFTLALELNIKLKNSIECKQDFKNNQYPLKYSHACYTIYHGEYTIYYDEHYAYKNFSIAHEIAHHLLNHTIDGAEHHNDANLLACILVAPYEIIQTHNIKSATEISEKFKMPCDIAEMYWNILTKEMTNDDKNDKIENELKKPNLYFKNTDKQKIILSAILIIIIIAFAKYYITNNDNNIIHDNTTVNKNDNIVIPITTLSPSPSQNILATQTPTNNPSEAPHAASTVFVTRYGEKYHKADCRHIKGSQGLQEMSIGEATQSGYEACKDCF